MPFGTLRMHIFIFFFSPHSSYKAMRPFQTPRPWFRHARLLRPLLAALGAPAPSTDHPGGSSLVATGCPLGSDRGAAGQWKIWVKFQEITTQCHRTLGGSTAQSPFSWCLGCTGEKCGTERANACCPSQFLVIPRQVDEFHQLYCQALRELFDTHKASYGMAHASLDLV